VAPADAFDVTDAGTATDAAAAIDPARFREPPADDRPYVRWWWPGDDVTDEELAREVATLAAAGFGGAEIQAFEAALDPGAPADVLARRRAVDSAAHGAHLRTAIRAAEAHGLQLDLTLGSGWPTGGPWVTPADSLPTLVTREALVEGPATYQVATLAPTKPPFYFAADLAAGFGERLARWLPDEARLVAVLAAPVIGGRRSAALFDIDDTLELDTTGLVDLTNRVSADGGLTWDVPAGRWALLSFFAQPNGEYVQLAAVPDPEAAFVVDHFDAAAVSATVERLLDAGVGLDADSGSAWRGVFVDSFELKAERLFPDDVLVEFERRRGYALTPWLPAIVVPGADDFVFEAGRLPRAPEWRLGPEDERVRHDYQQTLSELFVERFVEPVARRAAASGRLLRIQAYGLDVDVLRAGGAAHVPEAEQLYAGGSDLFVKMAAAAAHLYGVGDGGLVSAESFVWMLRDHTATPLKLKAAADKLFTAGVNHLVYHGVPYRHAEPDGPYGITGWAPFSSRFGGPTTYSDHFGELSTFWAWLPAVNRYVARCQYLLRVGRPEADLLVVYPWFGFPTSLALEEGYLEPLLGGWLPEAELASRDVPFAAVSAVFGGPQTDPRAAWLLRLAPILTALEDRGLTWDWVNPERLAAAAADADGTIRVGRGRWRGVLVFDSPALPPTAVERLATLAAGGAAVVVVGPPPDRQPGYHEHAAGDAAVRAAVAALGDTAWARVGVAVDGAAAAVVALVPPTVSFDAPTPLRTLRRRLPGGGQLVFLRNPTGQSQTAALDVPGGCRDARWLDPWTGAVTAVDDGGHKAAELRRELPPYGAVFLACGVGALAVEPAVEPAAAALPGASIPLETWDLVVERADAGGAVVTRPATSLGDWREDDALRRAAGPARYTARFRAADWTADAAAELSLAWVFGAADVTLNGVALGSLLVPPFVVDLTPGLRAGDNELVVTLAPPVRNHLVALAAAGDERYRQFAGREATVVAAGLVGPATLRCRGARCITP
jgi:hypothetical protein